MATSDHDLEKLAEHVGRAVVEAMAANDADRESHCEMCMTEDRRREHRQDHEFIRSLMALLDRLENVKWGVLSGVLKTVIAAGLIALAAFVYNHGFRQ